MSRKAHNKTSSRPAASGSSHGLVRSGVAALSLAGVCSAAQPESKPAATNGAPPIAVPRDPSPAKPVFVAKDALTTVAEATTDAQRANAAAFTLVRLGAFQKPPLEEALIEPGGTGSCACNTVCACVPVQSCSCNTVCTCDTVTSCGSYSGGGGGGGGGGGYGGYFCY